MLESPNFANRNRVSSRQQNLHHDSKVEAKGQGKLGRGSSRYQQVLFGACFTLTVADVYVHA
jgi:hypothetical protein